MKKNVKNFLKSHRVSSDLRVLQLKTVRKKNIVEKDFFITQNKSNFAPF